MEEAEGEPGSRSAGSSRGNPASQTRSSGSLLRRRTKAGTKGWTTTEMLVAGLEDLEGPRDSSPLAEDPGEEGRGVAGSGVDSLELGIVANRDPKTYPVMVVVPSNSLLEAGPASTGS